MDGAPRSVVATIYVVWTLAVLIWFATLDAKDKHRIKVRTLMLAIATLAACLALCLMV